MNPKPCNVLRIESHIAQESPITPTPPGQPSGQTSSRDMSITPERFELAVPGRATLQLTDAEATLSDAVSERHHQWSRNGL